MDGPFRCKQYASDIQTFPERFLGLSSCYSDYEETNHYLKGNPGKVLRKRFALDSRDLVFKGRRLSQIIGTSESTSTPRAPSVNLLHIRQLGEHRLIPQRHVDYPVVNETAQGVLDRLFLAASLSPHRDENPSVFASESASGPESDCRVPERLPLGGEISESSGDAEEECVVGGENIGGDYWVVWFGSSAHFLQHTLWECLWNPGGVISE